MKAGTGLDSPRKIHNLNAFVMKLTDQVHHTDPGLSHGHFNTNSHTPYPSIDPYPGHKFEVSARPGSMSLKTQTCFYQGHTSDT